MASAAEAKLGALFENAKEVVSSHTMLNALGCQQPATSIQVDNHTAHAIVNNNICQRKSKAINMRFYWVKDRVKQGLYWELGRNDKADYFTKHHPPAHHKKCNYLSPAQDRSNPEIAGQDEKQSTRFMSATSLAIGLLRYSIGQQKPMTKR
eukprot:1447523-Ditylum_brightwellii.AAC.1